MPLPQRNSTTSQAQPPKKAGYINIMGRILEAFADDSILTGSRSFKDNLEYSTAISKAVATEEKLISMLNESGKELLDEFSSRGGANVSKLKCK